MTPDEEEKLGRQMLMFERACYKLGLRDLLPVDLWSGRNDTVYLTDKAYEIYHFLLKNPDLTNEEISIAFGSNNQVIRNHLSILTRREIVRGFDEEQINKRGPIKLKYRVIRKINRKRER